MGQISFVLARGSSGQLVFKPAIEVQSNGAPAATPGIEVWRDDGILQANITATGYALDGGGTFHGNFARGTRAAPQAAQAGDVTGGIGSRVFDGNAFQGSSPASIHWQVTENTGPANYGMWLRFLTTPKGSVTRQERGGVTDNGTLWIHDTGTYDAKSSLQTKPTTDALMVVAATSAAGSTGATYVAQAYGTSVSPGLRGMASAGPPSAPTAVQADNILCFMGGHGYGDTQFSPSARGLLAIFSAENFTDANQGTYISIQTTPLLSTVRAEVARFASLRMSVQNPINLKNYTVATLPAAPVRGDMAYVTDANAPAFNAAVAGGGAVTVKVFYNGAAWVVG